MWPSTSPEVGTGEQISGSELRHDILHPVLSDIGCRLDFRQLNDLDLGGPSALQSSCGFYAARVWSMLTTATALRGEIAARNPYLTCPMRPLKIAPHQP